MTKTLNLDNFDGFTMAISGNVYIKQGSKQSVSVEAQQNIIDNIVTEVKDKEWKIKFEYRKRHASGAWQMRVPRRAIIRKSPSKPATRD